MAAPIGNQFWKLRSKHGRDILFSDPKILWEAACEYFQWCEDNPFKKAEAKVVNIGDYQSEVRIVEVPVMRPFTMQGLCGYLNCNTAYFRQFQDSKHEDFSTVICAIEDTVYNQKFSGAASGFLNANIIARDLGLSDKKDLEVANKNGNPFKWEIIDEAQQKD